MKSVGFGALSSMGVFAYGTQTGQEVEVVRKDLVLPNWSADGFRLGVLTDPHLDYPEAVERASYAVRAIIDQKPDLIVWAGDYLTSAAPQNLENVRQIMALMNEAPCPSFGVLGNHDYKVRYFDLVLNAVSSAKTRILRNERVEVDGVRLWGVDDGLMGAHRPDLVEGDKNTIVLFHEPDYVDDIKPGPSLQVSGHSHGGQICLPGGVTLHTPKGAKKYTSGYYGDLPIPLYVSRGVGTTGPNWRLFCPPEATILTLRGS